MTEEDVKKIIRYELAKMTVIDRAMFKRNLQLENNINIELGYRTGTKIATATNQKLGFYNTTPVVQQTDSVGAGNFLENSGTTINAGSTVNGYRFGQVVVALQALGLLE